MRSVAIIVFTFASSFPACAKQARHDAKKTVPQTRAAGVKTRGGLVRQVIRQAAMQLEVSQIDRARSQVEGLAQAQGGYVHSASYAGGRAARSWAWRKFASGRTGESAVF